jgi:hypothetical protein
MNTHELSRALTKLARVLRDGPKMEIDDLYELFGIKQKMPMSNGEIKIGLSNLVALSRVDKNKWSDVIKEYRFPIIVRNRDSSRDVLGKLLSYLDRNPEARERIKRSTYDEGMKASPQLMKALDSLLKE